jgi:hypothetical protein
MSKSKNFLKKFEILKNECFILYNENKNNFLQEWKKLGNCLKNLFDSCEKNNKQILEFKIKYHNQVKTLYHDLELLDYTPQNKYVFNHFLMKNSFLNSHHQQNKEKNFSDFKLQNVNFITEKKLKSEAFCKNFNQNQNEELFNIEISNLNGSQKKSRMDKFLIIN